MTDNTAPGWATVGAKVGVISHYSSTESVRILSITKINAKSLTDSDGERWLLSNTTDNGLIRREGGTWGTVYYMYPAYDGRVQRAMTRRRLRTAQKKLASTVATYQQNPTQAGCRDIMEAAEECAAAHYSVENMEA